MSNKPKYSIFKNKIDKIKEYPVFQDLLNDYELRNK